MKKSKYSIQFAVSVRVVALGLVFFVSPLLFSQEQASSSAPAEAAPTVPAPVEPAPTVPAPAEPAPAVKPFDPQKSYTTLIMPGIAAKMGLSDVQRAEVQRLLAERAQKLAAAPEVQWNAILVESEGKLADVLTPEQKQLWPKVFEERKIRFVFQGQKWVDVLELFARQAGLQLIMDAPPEGTFTYSDSREYTPREAIDMLNGVLQTKGYTLLRNDRMLMLFNLKKGRIPAQFVPKIKPEELADRGRFEFATIVFPLGRRDRALVLQTIEPFKGPYCHIIPMTGNSLMMTDTASALAVVEKVIQGVHEPPAPPGPPQPATPPPPPTWQVYPFAKIDAAEADAIIKEFFPTAKSLRLGGMPHLYVYASEAEHGGIKTIADLLEQNESTGQKRTTAAYTLDALLGMPPQRFWQLSRGLRGRRGVEGAVGTTFNPLDAAVSVSQELATIFKTSVPGAYVSEKPINGKLVVLATPEDHTRIRELIDALKTENDALTPEETPVVKLYRFSDENKKMDEETVGLIRTLFPTAETTFDAETGRLLVIATPAEHKTIAETVKEVDAATVPTENRTLVVYRVSGPDLGRLRLAIDALKSKELKGIVDLRETRIPGEAAGTGTAGRTRRADGLSVLATGAQHEIVRKLVRDLTGIDPAETEQGGRQPEPEKRVAVYPLEKGSVYSAYTLFQNVFPTVELSVDYARNALVAHGPVDVLDALRQAVADLDKGPAQELRFLSLKRLPPPALVQSFARIAPKAVIVVDPVNKQAILYGTAEDTEKIQTLITQSFTATPPESEVLLYVPKNDVDFFTPTGPVLSVLKGAFPEATFTADTENARLVVQTVAEDKEAILTLLNRLDADRTEGEELFLYMPKKTPLTALIGVVAEQFPKARITPDTTNNRFLIRCAGGDKPAILAMLDQLDVDPAESDEAFVYVPRKTAPTVLHGIVAAQFPTLKSTLDTANKRIIFRLKPGEKENLTDLLAKIDVSDPGRAEMLVFAPKHIDTETARTLLADLYPDATITPDTENNRLVIRLAAEDKKSVQDLLDQLDAVDPDRPKRSFKAFPLDVGAANATTVVQDIQKLVPRAKLTYDATTAQLIVWGTEEERKIVGEALANLQNEAGAAKRFLRLPLNRAEPYMVILTIYRFYPPPAATVSYDINNRTLIVEARPNVLKQIAALKETLDPETPSPNDPVVKFYALRSEPTPVLVNALARLVPTASIVPDKEAKQLMVVATPAEQNRIAANLKSIVESFTAPEEPMLFIYKLNDADRKRVEQFITAAAPELNEVAVLKDEVPGQLAVWAKPAAHKLLAAVLQQLESSRADEPERELRVFTFRVADARLVREALALAVPEATVIPDTEGERMLVWGTVEILEKSAQIVERLEIPDETDRFALGVYSFGDADPVMVESTLRNIVPDAESTSPDDLVNRLGYQHRIERLYGYNPRRALRAGPRPQPKNTGIFRVDPEQQKVFVFLAAAEHKRVEEAMRSLAESYEKSETKQARRFALKRTAPATVIASIRRLYPSTMVTLDAQGGALIVEDYAEPLKQIGALIAALDPAEPGPDAPVVRFYALESEPTPILLTSLRMLVPTARIIPDINAKQLMVIAKPHEQDEIAKNVKSITDTYTAPEEPMLVLYTLSPTLKTRAAAFLATARLKLPTLSVVPEPERTDRLAVWGTPTDHELLATAIERMRADDASAPQPELRVFDLEPENLDAARTMLAGSFTDVQLFPDPQGGRLLLWGMKEPLDKAEKAVAEIEAKSPSKSLVRFSLRRADPYVVQTIIARMYPSIIPTYDYRTRAIVVEGREADRRKVAELVALLDPIESDPNDPQVRFYKLDAKPSDVLLASLRQMVPRALIQPDPDRKQIMVVARPVELELFAKSLENIVETYSAPEEPVLVIYPADDLEKRRITAFIATARAELKTLAVVPDRKSGQLSVWATPTEHKLLTTVLTQIQTSKESEVAQELRSFPVAAGSLETATQVLTAAHPEATLFPDATGERLLVWANPAVLEKDAATLRVQGSIDDRQMLAYPALGAKPATLAEIITNVYPGLKITTEERGRRILVWATPPEHVKIAEIVEQANKEPSGEENAELAEKFVAYSTPNIDPAALGQVITALVPEVQTYADAGSEKLTVLARTREHARIRELVDQLNARDEESRPVLQVYPYGDADPVMLEGLLRSIVPNAESMSPDTIVYQLGYQFYLQRMPWYAQYLPASERSARKTGYFKVDPKNQTVFAFVLKEDQKAVGDAVQKLIAVGGEEGVKPTIRRYSLDELSFYDVEDVLQQVAPSAVFTSIYIYTPQNGTRRGYYDSYKEFLACARDADQEKIAATVKELNAGTSAEGQKSIAVITIPAGSRYERDRVLTTLRTLFPDVTPTEGAAPNQILIWAPPAKKERVQKTIDEACRPLPDTERDTYKTYPLRFAPAAEVVAHLKSLCPNATFEASTTESNPYRTGKNAVVAFASPLEHLEIAKTVAELDKDTPAAMKPVPRYYSLEKFPAGSYWSVYLAVYRGFANVSLLPSADQLNLAVVATEEEHKEIDAFLKAYLEQREQGRRFLEVYALVRTNYVQVAALLRQLVPTATIQPGGTPQSVVVWGTAVEQKDISDALGKLEMKFTRRPADGATGKDGEDSVQSGLRVYRITSQRAVQAAALVRAQFPSVIVAPTAVDELLAWASPSDHEEIGKLVGAIAEAYPEHTLKTYFTKHIPIGEAFLALQRIFLNEAVLSLRQDTGDLLVSARDDVHAKIAKNLEQLDRPRPEDVEKKPVAYDLSDLPAERLPLVAQTIQTALPGITLLPGVVAGQLVVWAREAEQTQVGEIVRQVIAERPEAVATMRVYTMKRPDATGIATTTLLRQIAPTARFGYGMNANQLLVWAKPGDQTKINEAIERMNEEEPGLELAVYSLQNTNPYTAQRLVRELLARRGVSATRITSDPYGNRIFIQANADDQKLVVDLLEKLRTRERDLEVFTLEKVDMETARFAVNALFAEEPYDSAPQAEFDLYTNTLLFRGTPEQIIRVRNMLVKMGESQLLESDTGDDVPAGRPRRGSRLRVLRIEGDVDQTIRHLEKMWPQINRNPLLINRQDEPMIQKKEEEPSAQEPGASAPGADAPPSGSLRGTGFYSLVDTDARKTDVQKTESAPSAAPGADTPGATGPANVYVTVNADGSLTVASYDTAALDRLEQLLERLHSRVVFEGRDYTIYSVHNVSAADVARKLTLVLRDRLAGGSRAGVVSRTQYGYVLSTPAGRVPLEIVPELESNTIYVKGSRHERGEVEELIDMFDVSELPGERVVKKPVRVIIKNTQASRIAQQMLNVYQQKLWATSLPGGLKPRITIDNLTNAIDIIAPEPLVTELKDYAEELDRRIVEEPARKVHVIPLEVNARVIQNAMNIIRQSQPTSAYPVPLLYGNPMQTPYPAPFPVQSPVLQQPMYNRGY